jgi:hypothetical protein
MTRGAELMQWKLLYCTVLPLPLLLGWLPEDPSTRMSPAKEYVRSSQKKKGDMSSPPKKKPKRV